MNRSVVLYSSSVVNQLVHQPRQQLMILNYYYQNRFISLSKRSAFVLFKQQPCYYSSKTTNNNNCQNILSKISTTTTKSATTTSSIGTKQKQRRLLTSSSNKDNTTIKEKFVSWWNNFTGPKIMPERYTTTWYREVLLICTVFGITGSSTMVLVRPAVSKGLGIDGSLIDGPWSYRVCSIVIMTPIYATLLVCVGTIFGRHTYFKHFAIKIFSRFGIEPELMDKNYQLTKKTFKKW